MFWIILQYRNNFQISSFLFAGLVSKRPREVAADDDQAGGQNPVGQAGFGPGLAVRWHAAALGSLPFPFGLLAHAGWRVVQSAVHAGQSFVAGLRLMRAAPNRASSTTSSPASCWRFGRMIYSVYILWIKRTLCYERVRAKDERSFFFNLLAQTLNLCARDALFSFYFEELKMLYVWAPTRPEDNLLLLHVHTLGVASREARKDDSLGYWSTIPNAEISQHYKKAPPGLIFENWFHLFRYNTCIFFKRLSS